MVKRKTVAVIGGGVSGLAAAKAFDERGHRVLGFERSHDFGGVWEPSRSYPDVQTQSAQGSVLLHRSSDASGVSRNGRRGRRFMPICIPMPTSTSLPRLYQLNTNIKSRWTGRADGKPGLDADHRKRPGQSETQGRL